MTYDRIVETLITEIDWPQCSGTTGWRNNSDCPASKLPINSLYQQFRAINRCGHRDYINSGVNGESINTLVEDGIVVPANYSGNLLALPARTQVDGPSTVFFAVIGNDICRAHSDGMYTPVDVFAAKALEVLQELDTKLAAGSHVIITAEIDGRVLYNTLQNAIHPIGATYPEVYDFLNCIKISPCWGWMNSNATVRNASSARAAEYNVIWTELIGNNTFQNFDAHFWSADMQAIIDGWVAAGNSAIDLIEPTDGFHPSTTTHQLIAADMFAFLQENAPDAIPQLNPNNALIEATFGDQGGYGY